MDGETRKLYALPGDGLPPLPPPVEVEVAAAADRASWARIADAFERECRDPALSAETRQLYMRLRARFGLASTQFENEVP